MNCGGISCRGWQEIGDCHLLLQELWPGTGNLNTDPLFVTGPGGDYYLSQVAAGQLMNSACVDAAGAAADTATVMAYLGSDGSPVIVGLDNMTTRTDELNDTGLADMGFHAGHQLPILVPVHYPTIQGAIDNSLNGDRIEVSAGTYYECIDTLGRVITVAGVEGYETTVIDGSGCGSVVSIVNGEGPDTVIEGFTLTGGTGTEGSYLAGGGGVLIRSSSPTIRNNLVTMNETDFGGGIYAWISSARIEGNRITGNTASRTGGGLLISGGAGLICGNTITGNSAGRGGGLSCGDDSRVTDNLIAGNEATGAVYGGGGILSEGYLNSPTFVNNLILNNISAGPGGGVSIDYMSGGYLRNCTIVGNQAGGEGGGVYGYEGAGYIIDSIIWGNLADQIYGSTAQYSCIEGGRWGEGNIDDDPWFVSGPLGDYYLPSISSGHPVDSPCIDAGYDLASAVCMETSVGNACLDEMTTATNGQLDEGQVDIGYHYPPVVPDTTVSAWLRCRPASGTLPFTTGMRATLVNNRPIGALRAAVRIDATLASGGFYSSWRAGWTNIPSDGKTFSWNQPLPNFPTLAGVNEFTLFAADVTPAPYNQPPFAPSGDTATHGCTVTGIAP